MEQVTVAGQAEPSVGTTQAPAGPAQDRVLPEQLGEFRR